MSNNQDRPSKFARNAIFGALTVIAIIGLIAGMVPLSQPRIPYNHLRAVHSTKQLLAAERQFAGSFPMVGFTCDLPRLAQAGLIDTVLASGDKAGYHYELRGCDPTSSVAVFAVVALPTNAGTTGKFAFCGNQEGVLWYSEDGSADNCLRQRLRWPKAD